MLAYVLAFLAAACLTTLALTKGEEVEEAAAPQQTKFSPRARRRIASRGKPRYTKKNKKGVKVKG